MALSTWVGRQLSERALDLYSNEWAVPNSCLPKSGLMGFFIMSCFPAFNTGCSKTNSFDGNNSMFISMQLKEQSYSKSMFCDVMMAADYVAINSQTMSKFHYLSISGF